MPIEIKELVIRATIIDEDGMDISEINNEEFSETDKQTIISTCVEEVLKILNNREER